MHEPTSELALAFHHLGVASCLRTKYAEAIPLLETSKDIRENLPNFLRERLFNSLYHLEMVRHCFGEHDKAEKFLETAIADRIEAIGKNDSVSMK